MFWCSQSLNSSVVSIEPFEDNVFLSLLQWITLLKFILLLNNHSKETKNHWFKQKKEKRFRRLCVWALIQCWRGFPVISTLCRFKWRSLMRVLDKQVKVCVQFFENKVASQKGMKQPLKRDCIFQPSVIDQTTFSFFFLSLPDTSTLCMSVSNSLNCIYYLLTLRVHV